MRLLELVRCGRPAVADESPSVSTNPETSEKRRRRHRRRSNGGADLTWQPSLGAIAEDGVVLIPPTKSSPSPVKAGKAGKNREKGRARRTTSAPQSERTSFRQYDVPAVFPAFAPTIFMF